jgi:hypothetical protein
MLRYMGPGMPRFDINQMPEMQKSFHVSAIGKPVSILNLRPAFTEPRLMYVKTRARRTQ